MGWIRRHRVALLLAVAALLAVVAVWRAVNGEWLGVFLPVVLVALAVQQARTDEPRR